jgi:hypothetical protein
MCVSERFNHITSGYSIEERSLLALWLRSIRNNPGGRDIALNFVSDIQTEYTIYIELINQILFFFRELQTSVNVNQIDASRNSYLSGCESVLKNLKRVYFSGGIANISSQKSLFKLMHLKSLQIIIAKALGETGSDESDNQEAWNNFKQYLEQDEELARQILEYATPCKTGVNWVYFSPHEHDRDPLANQSASYSLDQLGLPNEWYPRNKDDNDPESAWKVQYKLTDGIKRHIPALADTFPRWNPYFQVTRDTNWGWTRPIGSIRGRHGMPEVIHSEIKLNTDSVEIVNFPMFLE